MARDRYHNNIGVIIGENNKLQNVGNVNVATSHKIFYAQSCFTDTYMRRVRILRVRYYIILYRYMPRLSAIISLYYNDHGCVVINITDGV